MMGKLRKIENLESVVDRAIELVDARAAPT
jgi:hypothetical protein